MVYTVKKSKAGKWEVFSPFGTLLDAKATKKAAIVLASILAGWRGKVEVLA